MRLFVAYATRAEPRSLRLHSFVEDDPAPASTRSIVEGGHALPGDRPVFFRSGELIPYTRLGLLAAAAAAADDAADAAATADDTAAAAAAAEELLGAYSLVAAFALMLPAEGAVDAPPIAADFFAEQGLGHLNLPVPAAADRQVADASPDARDYSLAVPPQSLLALAAAFPLCISLQADVAHSTWPQMAGYQRR